MSWLCAWCAMFGKFPISEAYRPDDEEGVMTAGGEKICKTCATNWYEGKEKDKQGSENGVIQETQTT